MTGRSLTDTEFADRVLAMLEDAPPARDFEARLLADFAAIADRRERRRAYGLRRLAKLLWPGAPLWKPGIVFAASLACGLLIGALVAPPQTAPDTIAASQQVAETIPAFAMLGDL